MIEGSAQHAQYLLKTNRAEKVAEIMGVTKNELQSITRTLGMFPSELRRAQVKATLIEMSGTHTFGEMMEAVGMSRSAVRELSYKYGVKSVTIHTIDPSIRSACEAEMMNWSKKMSYESMATKLGVSRSTVRTWAKKIGVKGIR